MEDQNVHINVTGAVGGTKANTTQFTYHGQNGKMRAQLAHLNNELTDKLHCLKVRVCQKVKTNDLQAHQCINE